MTITVHRSGVGGTHYGGGVKILHTSDWHIGRTFHGADLHAHQWAFIEHLGQIVDEHAVDVVLVSGDVYDRAVPSVASVQLLAQALEFLSTRTCVVITPGNHDSAVRLGFAAELMTDRLRILANVEAIANPVCFTATGDADPTGVVVYGIPYLDPDAVRAQLADESGKLPGRSHEAVLSAAMDRVRADLSRRPAGTVAIVMAHAFVSGGHGSDSERDIRVGGVDVAPAGVFHGVDYVALGHLHSPQRISSGRPHIRYSGSPLAYSFSEEGRPKSTTLLTVDAAGINAELIPAPAPYRLATVTAPMDELMSKFEDLRDAWLRVRVTDTSFPDAMYARVKERFTHAMDIRHVPAVDAESSSTPHIVPEADPIDVSTDFIEYVTGAHATGTEAGLLADAVERARAQAGGA